jgi:hypothetical protein
MEDLGVIHSLRSPPVAVTQDWESDDLVTINSWLTRTNMVVEVGVTLKIRLADVNGVGRNSPKDSLTYR